ncbi:double-headed protease inhibitor, submandibular gland-like [Megalobrama amblycephala]|uniref:double-headed protease inhibitor, submandibular gland-like n=1 Tax=Megalobrama amblycephala TaxID=75352 RepID=UPI0020142E1A|nr:double-headed protease inhibitor, submandibular gland-like [Megalobrama amblycephala]
MFARGVIVLLCVLVAVSDGERAPDCKPNPSNACPEIYKPVCGSDGKTYSNECELCVAIRESGTEISIVKEGKCDQFLQPDCKPNPKPKPEFIVCTMDYSPVCGSDGKTYGNKCLLCAAIEESGTEISIVKEGRCDEDLLV